ncbi:unnamed protein product [Gongylonema pulchrum]|uniref:Uncharacterized protein n=1 Tax=Gongylonema pulchrum TaxID=637853 RepID=A0A3P6QS08_9BILA|nr:unnamed protein product [Gongylonema pulchrum]
MDTFESNSTISIESYSQAARNLELEEIPGMDFSFRSGCNASGVFSKILENDDIEADVPMDFCDSVAAATAIGADISTTVHCASPCRSPVIAHDSVRERDFFENGATCAATLNDCSSAHRISRRRNAFNDDRTSGIDSVTSVDLGTVSSGTWSHLGYSPHEASAER